MLASKIALKEVRLLSGTFQLFNKCLIDSWKKTPANFSFRRKVLSFVDTCNIHTDKRKQLCMFWVCGSLVSPPVLETPSGPLK